MVGYHCEPARESRMAITNQAMMDPISENPDSRPSTLRRAIVGLLEDGTKQSRVVDAWDRGRDPPSRKFLPGRTW